MYVVCGMCCDGVLILFADQKVVFVSVRLVNKI